jgi:hypothetical protein
MITSPIRIGFRMVEGSEVCRAKARQGEVKTKIPKPSVVPQRALSISYVFGF